MLGGVYSGVCDPVVLGRGGSCQYNTLVLGQSRPSLYQHLPPAQPSISSPVAPFVAVCPPPPPLLTKFLNRFYIIKSRSKCSFKSFYT